MQTQVKKWFQDKGFGFLENGTAQDIMVRKAELLNCQYLKVGSFVEFECHTDKHGLIAQKVSLLRKNSTKQNPYHAHKTNPFGVMT